MEIRIGHSPDADDAFMFYGLASGRVRRPGYEFVHVLRDIETLNRWALAGELEVTAVSVHAYPFVADRYAITACGASMGEGYGPVLVAGAPLAPEDLAGRRVAVPGRLTSATLALRLFLAGLGVEAGFGEAAGREEAASAAAAHRGEAGSGDAAHRGEAGGGGWRAVLVEVPFDRVGEAVRAGEAAAGLLIHEGQLTFQGEGLRLVADLGRWWAGETGLPLPLGVNAVRRDLPAAAATAAASALRESIEYGLGHREEALAHALRYARGLPRELADRFVGMYVNSRTLDMGEEGRRAIEVFLAHGASLGLVPAVGTVELAACA